MGISVDPLEFIIDWLDEKWNDSGLGFTPRFSTAPYERGVNLPTVCVREYGSPPEHLNIGSTKHYYTNPHGINIYDTDKGKIWKMRQEIRRIVYTFQKNPTTTTYATPGIESILIYDEFPQDDYSISPPVLSRSIRVFVIHLETNA